MELSTALSQRLKELQAWQQEAILTIRKAFTFDDVEFDIEKPNSVLDTGLVLVANKDGYGFYCEHSWILVSPEAHTSQIVVSKCVWGTSSITYIDTSSGWTLVEGTFPATLYEFVPEPEEEIQREIINFLAMVKLKEKPIDW